MWSVQELKGSFTQIAKNMFAHFSLGLGKVCNFVQSDQDTVARKRMLWAQQLTFDSPPLYWGGSRNLRERCLNNCYLHGWIVRIYYM